MDLLLLKHIVDGTNKDDMVYLPIMTPGLDELTQANLIETNVMIKDASGNIAVRATPEGIAYQPVKGTSMTLVVENIPVTKPERKVTREPSEASMTLRGLEVGQSVVIEADAKKAQSLINSTERHFSVAKEPKARKDGTMFTPRDYPRKFAAVVEGSGMRIGRVS